MLSLVMPLENIWHAINPYFRDKVIELVNLLISHY